MNSINSAGRHGLDPHVPTLESIRPRSPFRPLIPYVHRTLGWREVWIVSVILGLILPRAYLVLKFSSGLIDSDEAIVGLMARHILHGRELPIWYYGQAYMG